MMLNNEEMVAWLREERLAEIAERNNNPKD